MGQVVLVDYDVLRETVEKLEAAMRALRLVIERMQRKEYLKGNYPLEIHGGDGH